MALLFMDGFDAADFSPGRYSGYSITSTTASTRFSTGKAIFFNATAGPYLQKIFPATNQIFIGYAMYITDSNYGASIVTFYGDSGATKHTSVRRVSSTQWGIYRGETQLSLFPAPTTATWFYLEVTSTISDTVGTVIVRINGVTVATFNGDTKNGGTNTTIDMVRLGNDGGNYPACAPYIDDLYICDATGSTNNTFLGDVRVQTLVASGAGSSTQWAPTGGANYANISDIPDSVASYNSSSTTGERDLYAMNNLLAGTGTVYGIQENLHAWKSDAGVGSLKSVYKVGSTVYDGTTYGLGTSMAWYGAIRETNPATSTAWSTSDINALEAGVEVA